MKKYVIGALLISAVCIAASCKKPGNSSPASNLEGSWFVNKVYLDTNRNGIMDANELFTDTSLAHQVIRFNTDGTLVSTYYSSVSHGTWQLVNGNTYIKTTDTSGGTTTSYVLILSLTPASLEIKDTTGVGAGGYIVWEFLTKQ